MDYQRKNSFTNEWTRTAFSGGAGERPISSRGFVSVCAALLSRLCHLDRICRSRSLVVRNIPARNVAVSEALLYIPIKRRPSHAKTVITSNRRESIRPKLPKVRIQPLQTALDGYAGIWT